MKKVKDLESSRDVSYEQKATKRRKMKKRKVVEQVSYDRLEDGLEDFTDLSSYRDVYDSMRDW
jgi:hypothetical protein